MQVSLKYAQEHLPDLVSAANRGEEVEIAAPDQSPFRLTLVVSSEAKQDESRKLRQLGRLKGLIQIPTDEEWAAMDKELEELMVNAPLTTEGDI
jgi:antitoxin (DNA-binding transcriptional repressor) of toxin-antitoxin stability system